MKIVLNKVQSQKVFFWFIFVISFTLPEHNTNHIDEYLSQVRGQGQQKKRKKSLKERKKN